MKLAPVLFVLGAASTALGNVQGNVIENAQIDSFDEEQHHIPTSYESAIMGRRILRLTKLATFSTVFPLSSSSSSPMALRASSQDEEAGVTGLPVGLIDYVADCEDKGNPTILEIKIGTTFRNVRAGSNVTVSMRWTPPFAPQRRIGVFSDNPTTTPLSSYDWSWPRSSPSLLLRWLYRTVNKSNRNNGGGGGGGGKTPNPENPDIPDTVPYSADNLPRFALFGYLEPLRADKKSEMEALKKCYLAKHPDSRYWLPGNSIHASQWARMVVTKVYWVGGFGDRAYIGWIPAEEWHRVREEELNAIRLPGETAGWSEWNAFGNEEL